MSRRTAVPLVGPVAGPVASSAPLRSPRSQTVCAAIATGTFLLTMEASA